VVRVPGPDLADRLAGLVDRATLASGHAALSEPKRRTLPTTDGLGPPADRSHLVAGVVVTMAGRTDPVGYAPVVGDLGRHEFATEAVVDPEVARPAPFGMLIDGAVEVAVANGGGTLRLWVAQATPSDDAAVGARGFEPERDLVQMRCPLPLPPAPPGEPTLDLRPFRPGRDEAAWLATNNRAFAGHPEQGRWEPATLLEREQEPWFDPAGFLVADEEGRVAGSCWTKIHPDTDPPLGEIYVISVDPDYHGRGWGRALTRAGLDWLAGRGLTTGMLYVDGGNLAARSLYRSMGFTDHHVDRAYLARFA
jgi:mycothiol synthase